MLELIVDNTIRPSAAEQTLSYCNAVIAMRRMQACEDLAYYTGRRSALLQADPGDTSGLLDLYDLHIEQLADLIAHCDALDGLDAAAGTAAGRAAAV